MLDGQLENKLTLTNKDVCYDGTIKADALNKDMNCTIGIQAKRTPGKTETYTDMWAKFSGFEAGPFRPEFLLMGHSTDNGKSRVNGAGFATNWVYEKDISAAFHVCKDDMSKDVSRMDAMFHFRNTAAGNFFLRGDAVSKYFGVGHHDKTGDLTHVAELQYDMGGDSKGIMGKPFFLRAGFKYPLGKSTYTGDLLVNEKIQWSDKVSMPVTDNITVNSCLKYDV